MILKTSLTSRRQFLERSAWGFGSLVLSSSLLQSCIQDHIIPDLENPIHPPLGDDSIDWNSNVKDLLDVTLGFIPEGGEIITGLITIFWPKSESSPWDSVRAQVEALVDKKIADDDYNRVTANLAGLGSLLADYTKQIDLNADIKTYWDNAYAIFDLYQPNFEQSGDEILLLPLYAQFANLYLGLLRDAVANGKKWGMTDGEIQNHATKCAAKISEFTAYTTKWYNSGRATKQSIPRDDKTLEPFRSTNAFDRLMTMMVLDYMDAWPYYDLIKYPQGAQNSDGTKIPLFTREIYSDPYGNRINVDRTTPDFALPSPATQFPTQITVWGGHRIDAVQLTYPSGGGPNGATTTPRMGDQNGGTNVAPVGGQFSISPDSMIFSAVVSYDYSGELISTMAINTLQFLIGNGNVASFSPQMGGKVGQFNSGSSGIWYNDYALSSIYIDGVDNTLENSANCIVFGFKRWQRG